jgi:hypothetical protein
MQTEQIVSLLIQERDKLNRAIEALGGTGKRPGRPPKASTGATATDAPKPKHKLSPAGRKAIAAAARKRWKLIKAGRAKSPFAKKKANG